MKHTTAPYKYPRIVEFVEELPKTISGKDPQGGNKGKRQINKADKRRIKRCGAPAGVIGAVVIWTLWWYN